MQLFFACVFLVGSVLAAGLYPKQVMADAAQAPLNAQHTWSTPFVSLPGYGGVTVRVQLSSGAKTVDAVFLVDTGTGPMVVSQTIVDRMGLKTQPAMSSDGKSILLQGKEVRSVTLGTTLGRGDAVVGGLTMTGRLLVLSEQQLNFGPTPPHLDGVIGTDVLSHLAVGFDFLRQTLTLWSPGSLMKPQVESFIGQTSVALPLVEVLSNGNEDEVSSKGKAIFAVAVQLRNRATTAETTLGVDTGSNTTIIPRSLALALALTPIGRAQENSIDGCYSSIQARVSHLRLGHAETTDVTVHYPETGDGSEVLGLDVLTRLKVLLDFPGRKMYIGPLIAPLGVSPLQARAGERPQSEGRGKPYPYGTP